MWTSSRQSILVRSALLAALCLATLTAQAQATYRWVDKDGKVHYADQPPPPLENKEIQKKKLGANVVETSGPSYATQKAAQKFPLTLYTSANCIENCKTARDFLSRRGVPFAERVLKTQEDAAEFKQATGIGQLIVPVLLAGTKTEMGFQENAWRNLLDAAGYPQDSGTPRPKPPTK
ncbi:MAG: glutaredoxin family protein [Sterolibacterium sp.]